MSIASTENGKPTVILVHGAFADASSWNGIIAILEKDGYPVVAIANPLRSVKGDADYVRALVATINAPVVLVGHSYGGMVITNAANGQVNVKALVYVAAFAPEAGEDAGGLNSKFPGSAVGPALAPPVSLPGGGHDLYIQQDKFHRCLRAGPAPGSRKIGGGNPATHHRHCVQRTCDRARLEGDTFVVRLRRPRHGDTAKAARLHGSARRLQRDGRRERRVSRSDGFPSARGCRADRARRGRALKTASNGPRMTENPSFAADLKPVGERQCQKGLCTIAGASSAR